MGQGASGLPGAPGGGPPGGPGGDKKDDKKKKKFEPRPPLRTGKKKRKKGPSAAVRTPQGVVPRPPVLGSIYDTELNTYRDGPGSSVPSNGPAVPIMPMPLLFHDWYLEPLM